MNLPQGENRTIFYNSGNTIFVAQTAGLQLAAVAVLLKLTNKHLQSAFRAHRTLQLRALLHVSSKLTLLYNLSAPRIPARHFSLVAHDGVGIQLLFGDSFLAEVAYGAVVLRSRTAYRCAG